MGITPLNSTVILLLISSVLLITLYIGIALFSKYHHYRSIPYILASLIFLAQANGIIGIILTALSSQTITTPFDNILDTGHVIMGFVPFFPFLAYFLEIKRPGWLNLKRFVLLVLPVIIISTILLLLPGHPSSFHSHEELLASIHQTDVWLRLVLLSIYIIYPIAFFCHPRNKYSCLVSKSVLNVMQIMYVCLTLAFVAGLELCYFPAVYANFILIVSLDAFIAYIEFKVRIPIISTTEPEEDVQPHGEAQEETDFDDPIIWKDPDMSAVKLSRMMGTNRTYMSEKIKGLGYSGYSDMINRKRVRFICEKLEKEEDVNIINLFYEAGFRSRSTASSEFKRIVGCTPSEYLAKHSSAS